MVELHAHVNVAEPPGCRPAGGRSRISRTRVLALRSSGPSVIYDANPGPQPRQRRCGGRSRASVAVVSGTWGRGRASVADGRASGAVRPWRRCGGAGRFKPYALRCPGGLRCGPGDRRRTKPTREQRDDTAISGDGDECVTAATSERGSARFEGGARLLLSCVERPGIIAAVSQFLGGRRANIVELDRHTIEPEAPKPLRKRENRAAARFAKPSAGLEPATPSLRIPGYVPESHF
jgi:hypothetical protein